MDGVIWSKKDEIFVPLFSISTFSDRKNEFLKSSLQLENHNFQKEVLKIGYYEEQNMLTFIDNGTKLSGACGDIWMVLADYLNFTVVPVKSTSRNFGSKYSNNSGYTGLLGLLYKNESDVIPRAGILTYQMSFLDYTLPFWKISYKLYIRPEWKHDETWILHLFDAKVWMSIFLLFLIFFIAGYFCDQILTKFSNNRRNANAQDHVFYTIAIASTLGSIPHEIYVKSKIVYFTLSMFSWLILIAINSHTIIHMMYKKNVLPFTDVRSLIKKTNYYILAFEGSMVKEEFEEEVWKHIKSVKSYKRLLYQTSVPILFNLACSTDDEKYAAFEAEDNYRAVGRHICSLTPARTAYFSIWIGSAVKHGFKYKRSFDIGILKMSEVGLIDRLQEKWLDWRMKQVHAVPFESISLSQTYFIFFILFIGIVLSLLMLLAEYLTYSRSNLKKNHN